MMCREKPGLPPALSPESDPHLPEILFCQTLRAKNTLTPFRSLGAQATHCRCWIGRDASARMTLTVLLGWEPAGLWR